MGEMRQARRWTMSGNPVAWFEIIGWDPKFFGDPDGHLVGLSHGATAF
jgi:hypothetical protein